MIPIPVLVVVVLVVVAIGLWLALRPKKSPQLPGESARTANKIEPKRDAPRVESGRPQPKERESVKEAPREADAVVATPSSKAASDRPAPTVDSKRPPAEEQESKLSEVVAPTGSRHEPVHVPASPEAKAAAAKKDLAALKKGLQSTRGGWVSRLVGLFGGKKEIDPGLLESVQETLLTGDVGPKTTERLTDALKQRLDGKDVSEETLIWDTLRATAREIIDVPAPPFGGRADGKKPLVILVVGVNGVGKTTTIGKLASRYKDQGKKVYLAAGDTFRAAAVAQLEAWGKRVGVPVVKGKDLTKPSAVVFDAVQTGIKEGADIVIADTAGRLHTKTPLMDELRKLRDAAAKSLAGAPHEILLVLDATTGQNGIVQVKEFREALDLTGIVLTKLDGTAKGGIILGICDEFKLPVRFVGIGEKVDDLREFDADDFTAALFARPGDDDVAAA